jgi:CheY-like chemotaxis protein
MMPLILCIEDDQFHRHQVSQLLSSRGFSVEEAGDGLEGLQKALTLRPDLILMNLTLPRIDGLEVIAQLRGTSRTRDLPIVLMSKLPPSLTDRLAEETGVQGFVGKPVRREELMDTIQKSLSPQPAT